jgi:hypothetical protein
MKYRFSHALNIDYNELAGFVDVGEEMTKKELLEICSGQISFELLQYIRELEFERIGKDENNQLYLR